MQAKVYNQQGQPDGAIDLPESIFGLPWNADLVHQVVTGLRANQRLGRAKTKDRGEVRGGGKKPWRQKGTGRARHGSIRSPLWRGGGVTHGPRTERIYRHKINKKMRTKALWTVLSAKWRDGELVWLKDLKLPAVKTREAALVLKALAQHDGFRHLVFRSGRQAIIALPEKDQDLGRSFRNLPAITVTLTGNLNPLDLLRYRHLILVRPPESLKILSKNK